MYADSPGEFDRKLLDACSDVFNKFGFLVTSAFAYLVFLNIPLVTLYLCYATSVYLHGNAVLLQLFYRSHRTIYPTPIRIVGNHYHPGTDGKLQLMFGRIIAILQFSSVDADVLTLAFGKSFQHPGVDGTHLFIASAQSNSRRVWLSRVHEHR